MAKYKVIVSDPKNAKSQIVEVEGPQAQPIVGRQIGEIIAGSLLGLNGKLRITGGTDKDGIPLRGDVHGGGKKKVVLSGGVGFNPSVKGQRRRKLVRGRVITEDTYVINMVITPKEKKVEPKPKPKKKSQKEVEGHEPKGSQ